MTKSTQVATEVRRIAMAVMLFAGLVLSSGCAQVMAARQAAPLDRTAVVPGVERSQVVGKFGAPVGTDKNQDGTMTEIYSYTDGGKKNATWAKTGRILLYTAGDVFTAFLDQVIWMPAELLFRGTEYTATIDYERESNRWIARYIEERDVGSNEVVTQSGTKEGTTAIKEEGEGPAPQDEPRVSALR